MLNRKWRLKDGGGLKVNRSLKHCQIPLYFIFSATSWQERATLQDWQVYYHHHIYIAFILTHSAFYPENSEKKYLYYSCSDHRGLVVQLLLKDNVHHWGVLGKIYQFLYIYLFLWQDQDLYFYDVCLFSNIQTFFTCKQQIFTISWL